MNKKVKEGVRQMPMTYKSGDPGKTLLHANIVSTYLKY